MANHKSALKRIRQSQARRLRNRYYGRTMRNAVRKLRATGDKQEAMEMYPKVASLIDRNVKRNLVHKNKAANLKSKLSKKINSL
ncbi:MAG: 30S ribosomal protein S20 [Bacteroidales bacterium]|jgi:small subunit ribosomal protein S20|nr:30S ribosomal protein S20 [Bacteroidales bacterium]